ncbi:uncharacterized protein LOC119690439 [Plutella xylostella]|uniref:uncharacterized protein LOC119690439 n=1 Tax=Plutella xylostella TaxID=51655 RepID=UPI0020321989|nr:uncharacterized protein LOC119690439 [Plutella xylostella]
MFTLPSIVLRRRLNGQTSGSARRRARQRRQAELTRQEGERLARERRDQRLREKLELQRQAREELASFAPWGRAGGGAPNPRGVRFTDIRAKGIIPEDELRGVALHESRPPRRRRTPLRLREDPNICYSEALRQTVDNDIRYRQTPDQQRDYREILDDMVKQRNREIKDQRKRDLEYERKMQTLDGPWGRPGPGGAAWRNPRDIGLNFSNSMGWTDNEIFNQIKGAHRQKSSSLSLPPVKRDDDCGPQNQLAAYEKLPQIGEKENCQKEARKVTIEAEKGSGKRRKKSAKKKRFIKRLPNGERLHKDIPQDPPPPAAAPAPPAADEKQLTPETVILRATGGVELVPLLARRRHAGAGTLHSSDVTRPPDQDCEWREILNMNYLKELKNQMRVKFEQQEECRRDSAENVRQHHSTWASLWGREGHGAPRRGRYARSNLARLLYVPPLASRVEI